MVRLSIPSGFAYGFLLVFSLSVRIGILPVGTYWYLAYRYLLVVCLSVPIDGSPIDTYWFCLSVPIGICVSIPTPILPIGTCWYFAYRYLLIFCVAVPTGILPIGNFSRSVPIDMLPIGTLFFCLSVRVDILSIDSYWQFAYRYLLVFCLSARIDILPVGTSIGILSSCTYWYFALAFFLLVFYPSVFYFAYWYFAYRYLLVLVYPVGYQVCINSARCWLGVAFSVGETT